MLKILEVARVNKSFAFGIILVLIAAIMPSYSFSMTVEKGKLYFVGVGPAGPELATPQAIEVIKQGDFVF